MAFAKTKRLVNTYYRSQVIEIISTFLPKTKNLALIEIGCGNSDWLPWFCLNYKYRVTGVDNSQLGCQLAREKLKRVSRDYAIYCEDLFYAYNIFKEEFDILFSFGVIEHFRNPSAVLNIFPKYLKANSLIITACPNTGSLIFSLQKYIDKRVYDSHKKFDLNQLVQHHSLSSFQVLCSRYTQFMDLSVLDFSNYGVIGLLLKSIIKTLNLPLLYFNLLLQKIFRINPQNKYLSTSMIVIARKK